MIVDLSRPLADGMPVYPGDASPSLVREKDFPQDHYCAYLWRTGLHAGTHADAPLHMLPGGPMIDEMDLGRFIAPGILLGDMTCLPDREIPLGAAVLFETGMDALYGTPAYYTDHPALSEEVCEYLIQRRVSLVGVDAPSPDHPPFPIHKRLLAAGIPILENLTHLAALRGRRFTLAALPLALRAEASPVRAVAILDAFL